MTRLSTRNIRITEQKFEGFTQVTGELGVSAHVAVDNRVVHYPDIGEEVRHRLRTEIESVVFEDVRIALNRCRAYVEQLHPRHLHDVLKITDLMIHLDEAYRATKLKDE